jgi:pantothenate kinase
VNTVQGVELSFEQLVERATVLAGRGRRALLGITGAPGAGKSTLAERLVDALGEQTAVFVPMDGFHLASRELVALGRLDRKGAHDTFDGWGYAALLRRLRDQRVRAAQGDEGIVYAPQFRRDLEEPVGSAIPVRPEVPLVVTEGNYLLLEGAAWTHARETIDEVWFLAPDESQRLAQLIARHERYGRSPEEAKERSLGSDQRNAELISSTASRADLVVTLTDRLAELS